MRRYLLIFTLVWSLPVTAFLVNLLVDPYRIFHQPLGQSESFINESEMRIEASGIINTEAFDSIILGSSMAANFSATEASQIFNNQFVNISLNGSSITERSLVLKHAERKHRLAEVIFSLDDYAFEPDNITGTPIEPYQYLYDDSALNDLQIYISRLKAVRYALCPLTHDKRCRKRKADLEHLVEWYSDPEHSKRFGGLDKWLEAKNNYQIVTALESLSNSVSKIEQGKVPKIDPATVANKTKKRQRVFNAFLLEHVADTPDTRFYLFFPPYSRLKFGLLKQSSPTQFESYVETLRLVVKASENYPNVKVFGFETESFLDDIANYKDTGHYHQRFNSKMLHWMHNSEHELTPSNLEQYIMNISEKAQNYPLQDIAAQIDAYLQKQ